MRDAGGCSRLALDESIVHQALNSELAADWHKGKSAWARQLEGDERTSQITLKDVLLGLEDYFKIFRQIKKVSPDAYTYFSRVGAPLCFESTRILAGIIENSTPEPVTNAKDLPAYFGLFMARSKERARDVLIN